ncbi:MAG TPA: cytochrome c [Terriglobia bacterium]|nr:cytochrome c [Terriglobia bacterium]
MEIGDRREKRSQQFPISNFQFPICIFIVVLAFSIPAQPHDIITTPVTWDKEISRIFYSRCISCHREGGMAFSMAEYKDAFPWRTAIKEEVLERRMPPWGAVKGFGDFRNDQALTPEQLELLTSWAQGGSPEGQEADLPAKDKLAEMMKDSAWFAEKPHPQHRKGEIIAGGELKLTKPFKLDGLLPITVPADSSFQVTAEYPDGEVEPLLWLDGYKPQFEHPFLFRSPLSLPAGTIISGIPQGVKIALLPPQK